MRKPRRWAADYRKKLLMENGLGRLKAPPVLWALLHNRYFLRL